MLTQTEFAITRNQCVIRPDFLRAARMRYSSLVALFLVSSLLMLLATWWWLGSNSGDENGERKSIAFTSQLRSSLAGIDPSALRIKAWHTLDDFSHELAQFETVFWDPADTTSLRLYLAGCESLKEGRVLEIGTGTGIVSLYCAEHGATRIVATDINPQAVANTLYNADLFGVEDKLEVRVVSIDHPGPFAVINAEEKFDLIISNPPWEDAPVEEVAAHALYDPGFALLDGLLEQSATYLHPNGKLLLAYGAKKAIERIVSTAPESGWTVRVLDDRELDSLPEVFVPGVLLELSR